MPDTDSTKKPADVRWWIRASFVLLGMAAIAFVLVWGSGPLVPGGNLISTDHLYWSLPGWLALVSVATLLLAPPAVVVCWLVALRKRRGRPFSTASIVVGIVLVFVLLLMLRVA